MCLGCFKDVIPITPLVISKRQPIPLHSDQLFRYATRSLLERRHVSISLFASVWYCWPTNGKQNISFVGATYIVPYIHSLRVNHLICLRGLTKMPNLTEKGVLSKVFGTNFWTIDNKWFCSWTWDIASDREIKKYKILIILFLTFLLIS